MAKNFTSFLRLSFCRRERLFAKESSPRSNLAKKARQDEPLAQWEQLEAQARDDSDAAFDDAGPIFF